MQLIFLVRQNLNLCLGWAMRRSHAGLKEIKAMESKIEEKETRLKEMPPHLLEFGLLRNEIDYLKLSHGKTGVYMAII